MPDHCCVPGCRGNYTGTSEHPHEKVSVFKFPSDPDMRVKWLLFNVQHRYSPHTLVFAFQLLCVSRAGYELVHDRVLTLSHISYLRKLLSIFCMQVDAHDTGHVVYLREKAKVLQEHERHVVLLLDEIHVNPKTTYKGGSLLGVACNMSNDEATTVQTFMICSVLSGNKDVAAMLPVTGLTAEYLLE